LQGDGGDDTYVWAIGDGNDTIRDTGSGFDTIEFGAGIVAGDISYEYSSADLTLIYGPSGARITLAGENASITKVIEQMSFADGTVVSLTNGYNFSGTATNNSLFGGLYADTIQGLDGNDQIYGREGDDHLYGGPGNDVLNGQSGDDTLEGGTGDDVLDGGDGIDTASYASAGTDVQVDLRLATAQWTNGVGTDTLFGIENLSGSDWSDTLIGDGGVNVLHGGGMADLLEGGGGGDILYGEADPDHLYGDDGDDSLYGGSGNDWLDGGSGDDLLFGGEGDDIVTYESAGAGVYIDLRVTGPQGAGGIGRDTLSSIESLFGSNFSDTLIGDDGTNFLVGNDGGDRLIGGLGEDFLYGGAGGDILGSDSSADVGNDWLEGGAGDDLYYVGAGLISVVEAADAGADMVVRYGPSYSLPDNVEYLSLIWSGAATGIGNALGNVIYGGGGTNALYGMDGGDWLEGKGLADTLYGGNGDDHLDGGMGADVMDGGPGNDRYYVDNVGDVIVEAAGDGAGDTVIATIDYTLGANIEYLTFSGIVGYTGVGNAANNLVFGAWGNDTISGLEGNDWLISEKGNDTLYGGAGSDHLDGGVGADQMVGGAGDDLYFIDDAGDTVIELSGEGDDQVFVNAPGTSFAFTLGANIEYLHLLGSADYTGTGNAGSNGLFGAAGNDTLYGLDGNDWLDGAGGSDTLYGGNDDDHLDGGAGADHMDGGAGNDNYTVDNTGDVIVEAAGAGGDSVSASVSYALSANIENLFLSSSAGLTGTGNAQDNVIIGSAGADTISGMDGNDWLQGGAGADTLTGGAGADLFVFASAGDFAGTPETITDFSFAQGDRIVLWQVDANSALAGDQAFSWIGTGAFTSQAGQLRYDYDAGLNVSSVFGDLDGDGVTDFTLVMNNVATVSASDFFL
jgi:Ca2+-binding RTX toxin-like protein